MSEGMKLTEERARMFDVLMDSGATLSKREGKYTVSLWGLDFVGDTASSAIGTAWVCATKKGSAR